MAPPAPQASARLRHKLRPAYATGFGEARCARPVGNGHATIPRHSPLLIQKKVVLLGASGVGKTSLVRQFVESLFDERYLTTIGVKVDKKRIDLDGEDVTLMLWDIAGAEEHFSFPSTYVRGAAGYILVVDGTRSETLDTASAIVDQVLRDVGPLPCVVAANKADLADSWRVTPAALDALREKSSATVLETSAKTGAGVEDAFQALTRAMLARQ